MNTWLIGDIQGCWVALKTLLEKINFSAETDRIIFTGDLLNRGDNDLAVAQWCLDNQHAIETTLGNHDLHFLAVVHGAINIGRYDTFQAVLDSPIKNDFSDWLLNQPLMIELGPDYYMTHAGINPDWSIAQAMSLADELSGVLRSDARHEFFNHMYGNTPSSWSNNLTGIDRLRCITNFFTRMRFYQNAPIGEPRAMDFSSKGVLTDHPHGYAPWYACEHRFGKAKLAFGHWAALCGETGDPQFVSLDEGSVWQGYLCAQNLTTGQRVKVKNPLGRPIES